MAPAPQRIEFWYDFASTYSYLSAMRIEGIASAGGVEIMWRPFLLGPIFKSQGWTTSPFNIYPAKGRYMARDIERIAAMRGLTFRLPEPFPAPSLLAARIAFTLERQSVVADYTRAVFSTEFSAGGDIANPGVLSGILSNLGLNATICLTQSEAPDIKEKLRQQTARAQSLGIFGAPTFVTPDQELFWGDDRLEQSIAWAQR